MSLLGRLSSWDAGRRRRAQSREASRLELQYRLDEARRAQTVDRQFWLRERDRLVRQLDELRRRLTYLEELMLRRRVDERALHAAGRAREAAASGFGELPG